MPGRLNARSIFDPRFTERFAFTAEKGMTSVIQIRRRKAAAVGAWNFDTGTRPAESDYEILWQGMARPQPNKDWRARGYTFGDSTTVFQACRFQVSLAENDWDVDAEPLARRGWDPAHTEHVLRDEDQIIIAHTFWGNLERIEDFIFVIRNPLISGNAAVQNILTDVDLKGGVGVGNP